MRQRSSSARTRGGHGFSSTGTASPRRLVSFHRHNEAARTAEILPRLQAGEKVALASDAGLPGVNDPGARLISVAIEHDVPVTVLPGPSAVETALVASGLVGERYTFLGFLPRAKEALSRLWAELPEGTTVAFESPRRLPASLASLAAAEPSRPVAVCRELTKRFEEVVRGSAAEVAARFLEPPKGEITLVIGPGALQPQADEKEASEAVSELVEAGIPRRRAADIVARLTGLSKNRLYRARSRRSRFRSGPSSRMQERHTDRPRCSPSLFVAPTEHADGVRLLEQDRVAVHRDLDRVFLHDAEPLPDLDRNHDPPQLVDVPDDARGSSSVPDPRGSPPRPRAPRHPFGNGPGALQVGP